MKGERHVGGEIRVLSNLIKRCMDDGMPPDVKTSLEASIPFPSRLGQPGEYADLVAYILRTPYLNGETIRLDGATRLAPK